MVEIAVPVDMQGMLLCSECANYLSVGPVVLTPEGDPICGRCPKPKIATDSLYNLIAEKCFFRCVNRETGCEKLLNYTETAAHEKLCKNKKDLTCPCCDFVGNGCQLRYHFDKRHANSVVTGSTVREILSYHELKNYVDYILNMNPRNVRLFVRTIMKLFSLCAGCKGQFSTDSVNYFCPQYHNICAKCSQKGRKYPQCNVPCQLNKLSELNGIVIECEWDECPERINIFQYINHIQLCEYRKYKCPSRNCNYVGSLEGLKAHWHLNALYTLNAIDWLSNSACYWLIPDSNEILYIQFSRGSGKNIVTIDEEDVVSPYSYTLRCESINCNNRYDTYDSYSFLWQYKLSSSVKKLTIGHKVSRIKYISNFA